jgi:hypothetical protein
MTYREIFEAELERVGEEIGIELVWCRGCRRPDGKPWKISHDNGGAFATWGAGDCPVVHYNRDARHTAGRTARARAHRPRSL